ncbi:carboxymuconolactone decarboxylase family protein [Nocardioides sp. REDSEA-S30_B4]|uniref:carboxymuconolactone decarboxylase family protein n=1 Tax=Nocardioides sp. REDSEA-S30_B4 TaxID=1811552 RepID=UPI000A57F7D4|nr:carboxymuconolactone decarboxylase family protein [Nocardioides sp. REDSEA-S30_B4]
MSQDTKYDRGIEIMNEIHGSGSLARIGNPISEISPDFFKFVVETGFADVYGRPDLSHQQRQLINVAVLTALGDTEKLLTAHMRGALHVGVSPAEIIEAIFHVSIYAGHPRTIRGLDVAKAVFAAKGIAIPLEGNDSE